MKSQSDMRTIFTKCLLVLSLMLLTKSKIIFGQDVFIALKTETNATNIKFKWQDLPFEEGLSMDESTLNFSLAVTAQLKNRFYLKTALGSNSYKSLADLQWETADYDRIVTGWFSVEQRFIEVLPEVRFFNKKWLFVNAGFGMSSIVGKDIFDGYRAVRRPPTVTFSGFSEEESYPYYSQFNTFFAFNIGFHLNFDKVGVSGAYGIRNSNYTQQGSEIPGIGFHQKLVKLGITYQIK